MFGTKHSTKKVGNINLKLNDSILYKEPYCKYLGIVLDSNLNYKQNIDQCVKIVSHKIYLLSKICKFINEDTAISIFKSMIAPIIDYRDVVYMGGTKEGLDRLQKLQNRALRICLDLRHYLPTILLHQQTQTANLITRRSCNIKKYMFKQMDNIELIKRPKVNTRLNDAVVFVTSKPNLEKYRNNPLYRGALVWNALSPELRNIETYVRFKDYCKKWANDVTMLKV